MSNEIGIILLAGGKSSRMGEDKGLMSFKGKAMISHALNLVQEINDNIIIITNNNEYKKFGYPVYEDIYKEKGPMGGIYTGLTHSRQKTNIVLSCDSPFIEKELLLFLVENSHGFDITVPVKEERSHQLIGVYSKTCLHVFKSQIESGNYKLRDSFEYIKVNLLDCNKFEDSIFKNINSKNDIC